MDVHEPRFTDYDAQTFCGALELYLRQNPGRTLEVREGPGGISIRITTSETKEKEPTT